MFYGMGRAGTMRRGGGRGGGGGGSGFGFRGATPPWPYIGLGRGGLPRCGYYYSQGVINPADQVNPAYTAGKTAVGSDEELNYLKYQAEVLKKQLEQIELRISGLEAD